MDVVERVRAWLADRDVVEDDGVWLARGEVLSADEVAHEWARELLEEPYLNPYARLLLGFGLLDLLDAYPVTVEIRRALDPSLTGEFWANYRRRLEAPKPPEAILESLWTDLFVDEDTAPEAFAEVLGNDLRLLHTPGELRRARRVLTISAPVPWTVKDRAYRYAATRPDLRPALPREWEGPPEQL
ncbi:hypothetical protein [Amycolatopsis magusensis]|uniref:hypothetical protein n=1 Tax=Amycolatopsis magusensis TaxID=882444 RepID=UPI0037989621